jgi:hypothetical protein
VTQQTEQLAAKERAKQKRGEREQEALNMKNQVIEKN